MRLSAAAAAAILLALPACGGSGSTAPPATLSISVASTTIVSGTTQQASAVLSDGTTPSGVTWSTTNSMIAAVSTSGLITATKKGVATITATAGTRSSQIQVSVVPGPANAVVIYSGDGQIGARGSQLPAPLCTNVLDAAGNLIVGATVTYTVTTGAGALASPTAPQTDPSGIATSGLWTLGSSAGQQTVTATVGSATVVFKATAQ
ncbi:MAG TPA: Ig-like domain-containing protein [Gemmatimonadaceae bacterium]|nr:Ig-like domain-containing protein [Gemmatimonadaceae bacterium]